MELQAVSGQLYVIEGAVQETMAVPGLLAQPAPGKAARGRERDFLFVHLTLTGQIEETAVLTQDLLDIVSKRFYSSPGSVTSALRQALLQANEALLRLNLSGSNAARHGALTCAALRSGELFMVQAGEALALLGHNFGVERLPAREPERITPLGRSAGLDLRYYHHRLQPGNMLLLADPRQGNLSPQTLAPALVDTEIELGLDALVDIIGSDSARLLLVEFTDDAPASMSLPAKVRREETPQRVAEVTTGTVAPVPRRDHAHAHTVPAAQRRPQPERTRIARPALDTTELANNVGVKARQATAQTAFGLSRLTGGLADVLARLRPPDDGQPRDTRDWAIPAVLAVFIPLLIAFIVTGVYLQQGQVRRFAEIKVEMGQNMAQAEGAPADSEESRIWYQQVVILANEADELRPGDTEINRLRQEARRALDRLDNVIRLQGKPFYTYGETADLQAVVLRPGFNGGIYTLDNTNSRVYLHETDEEYLTPLTEEPQQLLVAGQPVRTHVVNDLVDMIWRPQGTSVTQDGLILLDNTGVLISYHPNFANFRTVELGLSSEWRLPAAITTFDERLYILDTGARTIWKYYPDGDNLVPKDGDRAIYFDEANDPALNEAVDMAIYSEDGSLAVTYNDGRFRYYDTRYGRVQWNEASLLNNGLNSPIVSPVAIKMVGRGLNTSIFLADPGSGRIIQMSRGGTVLAQYRAADETGRELFTELTDFAVAESPLRIFVTTRDTLYVVTQE